MKPLCIYHSHCPDGFGAAWVFWHHGCSSGFDFHPGVHQTEPPDVTGRDVYLVDFSYRRPVVEQMLEKAKSITLIDHHKSAIEDLQPLIDSNRIIALVNLNKSGATLAWQWWYGGLQPPELLEHIEDGDLWRFWLANTREITSNLESYPYDFGVWTGLMARPISELISDGRAIERRLQKDINEILPIVTRRMNIGGYNVPIANLPYTMTSDAGAKLCKGEPFAGCYFDMPHGRGFGLRSTDAGVDVSEVAKQYGGGGHRNAAGFTVSYEVAATFESKS